MPFYRKVVFTMADPIEKKHSTRFQFEKLEDAPKGLDLKSFRPSFYLPKPVAETSSRIRITIEELE